MGVVVVDNGSWVLKGGYATDAQPRLVPNFIVKAKHDRKRVFVGEELADCSDKSGLFFCSPFERGFLIRWEEEHQIWDRLFGASGLKVAFPESTLICTEPPLNFPSSQETLNEVIFEDYAFAAALRTTAGSLAAHRYGQRHPEALGVTVVDSGYSFSHVLPHTLTGPGASLNLTRPIREAVTRVNVGGKILTNHLKEVISYRQLQVMEEFYVMNQCKEDACFVSADFCKDMARAKEKKNELRREYVLPDFAKLHRGVLREPGANGDGDEQVLRLCQERFSVPELLFSPSDVGIPEMGLGEAAAHAVLARAPEPIRPHLARHVLLIGGNAAFPGFKDRMEGELRSGLPELFDVGVSVEDPSTYAWQGGAQLGRDPDTLKELAVTREEFLEQGHSVCIRKFRI